MHRIIFVIVSYGLISWFAVGPVHGSLAPASNHGSDKSNNGNGNHNRNAIGIKSPTSNQGYQHTNNGNAGGLNSTLNTLCRQVVKCKMTQNLIIIKVSKGEPVKKNDRNADVAAPSGTTMPAYTFLYRGPDGIVAIR